MVDRGERRRGNHRAFQEAARGQCLMFGEEQTQRAGELGLERCEVLEPGGTLSRVQVERVIDEPADLFPLMRLEITDADLRQVLLPNCADMDRSDFALRRRHLPGAFRSNSSEYREAGNGFQHGSRFRSCQPSERGPGASHGLTSVMSMYPTSSAPRLIGRLLLAPKQHSSW